MRVSLPHRYQNHFHFAAFKDLGIDKQFDGAKSEEFGGRGTISKNLKKLKLKVTLDKVKKWKFEAILYKVNK